MLLHILKVCFLCGKLQ